LGKYGRYDSDRQSFISWTEDFVNENQEVYR